MPIPAVLANVVSSIGSQAFKAPQTIGENLMQRGISKVSDKIGNAIFGKPDGIPAPMTGTEAGQFTKDYMDTAFGGTTPWERLGSSQSGAPQQATLMNAKMQDRTVDKQLNTQKQIAEATNRAQIISQLGQFGPQGIEYGLGKYSTSIGVQKGFDTAVSLNKRKLPYEIAKLTAEQQNIAMQETENYYKAVKTANEADREFIKLHYEEKLQQLGLNESASRNVLNWANAAKSAVQSGTDIFDRLPGGIKRLPPKYDYTDTIKGPTGKTVKETTRRHYR